MLARIDAAQPTLHLSRGGQCGSDPRSHAGMAPGLLQPRGKSILMLQKNRRGLGRCALLREALSNLIDNAQRYGGTQIMFGAKLEGDTVTWSVSDNGSGIGAQHHRSLCRVVVGDAKTLRLPLNTEA